MNYLGHYEFGLTHRPWFENSDYQNSNKLDYWIKQWILFYENILDKYQFNKNCNFIIYEKLTNTNYVKNLLKKVKLNNVKNINLNYFKNSNNKNINIEHSTHLYERALKTYSKFF